MKVSQQKSENGAGFVLAQVFAIALLAIIFKAAVGFQDVTEALGFYGVYHQNPYNQLIHFFGVPGILWSILIILAHVPVPFLSQIRITVPGTPTHPISYATILFLFYALFFIYMDTFGGLLYAPVVYAMYVSAIRITANDQALAKKKNDGDVKWTGTGKALMYAAIIHVLSWYVQIHPGHAILEGAKPAVLDSLGGALTSAPLFAFYEGLWFLGFNRPLQEQTLELVAENLKKMCEAGATMRACANI